MHPLLANLIAAFDAIPDVNSIYLSTYTGRHDLDVNTTTDVAALELAATLGLAAPNMLSDDEHHWLASHRYGGGLTIRLTGPMHAFAKTEAA